MATAVICAQRADQEPGERRANYPRTGHTIRLAFTSSPVVTVPVSLLAAEHIDEHLREPIIAMIIHLSRAAYMRNPLEALHFSGARD